MVLRVVLAGEFQFGQAEGLEAVCHLGHVALEDPHGHGRRVLKEVVGPWKRVGVVGIGGTPHGGATGRVDDAHVGTTAPRMAFGIQPLEVAQLLQQAGDVCKPAGIYRFGGMGIVQRTRQFGKRQVAVCVGLEYRVDGRGIAEIHAFRQLQADMLFQAFAEVFDLLQVAFHPRLHQCRYGGGKQVDYGLFTTPQAGAVATGQ